MINKYPYTDIHELNLDWIIEQMQKLDNTVKGYIAYNNLVFADPIEWSPLTFYKKNTIVLASNGDTYVSKEDIPAGFPLDGEKWQKIGNYNAQIGEVEEEVEEIRYEVNQTVTEIRREINTLSEHVHDRTFLLFGDSLADGYTPGVENYKGWAYWCKKSLEDKGYKVYIASGSGVSGQIGTAFAGQKQYIDHYNNTKILQPEILNENITDIIVYTGTNDSNYPDNDLKVGIQNFIAAIKNDFPMADIKIGFFSARYNSDTYRVMDLLKTVGEYGASYIKNTCLLCCDATYVSSDDTHLTQDGYKFYSKYLADGIISGSVSYRFTFPLFAGEYTSTNLKVENLYISLVVCNDVVYARASNGGTDRAFIRMYLSTSGGYGEYDITVTNNCIVAKDNLFYFMTVGVLDLSTSVRNTLGSVQVGVFTNRIRFAYSGKGIANRDNTTCVLFGETNGIIKMR